MVNKITRKAILDANKNYEAYTKERDTIKEKIATIDEKYRKLAEKEAKELKESLDILGKEQTVWRTVLSSYPADVVNEVLSNDTSFTDKSASVVEFTSTVEEEEKVIDTLFRENNAIEETSENEPIQTESEKESEEIEPDSTEEIENEENISEDWPEETEEKVEEVKEETIEEETSESFLDTEEDWPVMPEEWK